MLLYIYTPKVFEGPFRYNSYIAVGHQAYGLFKAYVASFGVFDDACSNIGTI